MSKNCERKLLSVLLRSASPYGAPVRSRPFFQAKKSGGLGDFAGGFFEEFVDQGLVGFGLLGGHAAELAEKIWGDADGDELKTAAEVLKTAYEL